MKGIGLHVGPRERDGRRLVIASVNGHSFRSKLDIDAAWERKKYREAAIPKLFPAGRVPTDEDLANWNPGDGGCNSEDLHGWFEEEIIRKADAEDARKEDGSDWSPIITRLDTVQPLDVKWSWRNRLAIGKLNDFSGNAGLGKTLLALDITARGSTGSGWPDDPYATFDPWGTVWMTAEDDIADTIVPRLIAASADLKRIAVFEAVKMKGEDGEDINRGIDLGRDLPRLEEAIDSVENCRLLVIDPIDAYLGDVDAHKNADVRGLLAPLAALAARKQFAVLSLSHLNKGQGQAIHRRQGSVAFTAAARSAWLVARDRDNPKSSRRLFLPIKANLAQDVEGLAFVISSQHSPNGCPLLEWEPEPVRVSADDALSVVQQKKGPQATALPEAIEFLTKALANGMRPTLEVEAEAKARDISTRTLKRARDKLGVISSRPAVPGPWFIELPQQGQQQGQLLPHGTHGPLGTVGPVESFTGNNAKSLLTGGIEGQEDPVNEWLSECATEGEF